PDIPVQLGHVADGVLQFTDPRVIHWTYDAELKATFHFLHPHMVRVRDLPPFIEHIHAVVEFIAHARAVVESLDDIVELLFHLLSADLDLGKTLDQVDTRARSIEGGKHDRRRGLVGLHQQHQYVDEQAFVVRPAVDEVPDQRQSDHAPPATL